MEELLQRLEHKIRDLADQHHLLKNANQQLDQRKVMLTKEKEALLARQEKAIGQIKGLVARLKAIEQIA
jgi:hypothetical protein